MARTVLRYITESTGATLLDLNDPAGFHLVRGGIVLGTAPVEGTWLSQPPHPGAIPAGMHRPNVEMALRLMLAPQPTWADVASRWAALAAELDKPVGVIEFKPDGASSSYLIDVFRSPVPSLFRGQDAASPETYKGDPEPVDVLIYRKPLLRGAGTYI